MPKLSDDDVLKIITEEFSYAIGGSESDQVESERRNALAYYLGLPNGKEVEGRSKVTSTDVADAIEWIMPQIMESLTANNEVVVFDPQFEGDEVQADLESSYVYDILMKKNMGFVTLHYMIKDALMQKNGFLEVYYTSEPITREEKYTGISTDAYALVQMEPNVEITEQTEYIEMIEGQPVQFYDVTVSHTYDRGQIIIEPIAQEDFRVNRAHKNVSLEECRFAARLLKFTRSELKAMGVDPDLVDLLKASNGEDTDSNRNYRHLYEGQDATPQSGGISDIDKSEEEIECARCVVRMDLDGTGISRLYKVLLDGSDNPEHILMMEEIDESPFVNCVAILMSHTVNGLSIYDRLRQIQDQKTALLRSTLDNVYLQNNQRMGVIEGMVNLDDLLISRPGGIIRMKSPDAIFPIVSPGVGQDAQNMMEYLDRIRAGRVGVSPEGNATPQRLGEEIGSQGIDRLMTASEALVGLIVRVVAETGLKPVCLKIRNLARKHHDVIQDYKFKGVWYKINPASWKERENTSIRVGTGTGDRNRQVQMMQFLLSLQEKILMNPAQALVEEQQVFNAINDTAKFGGLTGIHKYFVDPQSQMGQQLKQQKMQSQQQNQQLQQAVQQKMLEANEKLAQAENIKAAADIEANRVKLQNDQMSAQIDQLKLAVQEATKNAEIMFKYDELFQNIALKLTELEKDSEDKNLEREHQENVRAVK